jgi:hypothetical protein
MSDLSVKPTRRFECPLYPTKLEVRADNRLLARHLPAAWLGHRELAGAAAACLAIGSVGMAEDQSPLAPTQTGAARSNAAIVAPVFTPEGTASPKRAIARRNQEKRFDRVTLACVAVSPPVYVSEEEALQIIKEELGKQGLDLCEEDVVLESVQIKGTYYESQMDWVTGVRKGGFVEKVKPLQLDLKDPQRNVGIEYIARGDLSPLGGGRSTASHNPRAVAQYVSQEVENQGENIFFGALYDPQGQLPADMRYARTGEQRQRAEAECRRLIRLQVTSFVEWLKGQGVI